jgi:hypothetical protein
MRDALVHCASSVRIILTTKAEENCFELAGGCTLGCVITLDYCLVWAQGPYALYHEVDLPLAFPLLERELSTAFRCNAAGNAVSTTVCSGNGHRRVQTNSTDEHYIY